MRTVRRQQLDLTSHNRLRSSQFMGELDIHQTVQGTGEEDTAIIREQKTADAVVMSLDLVEQRSCVGLPEVDVLVSGTCEDRILRE